MSKLLSPGLILGPRIPLLLYGTAWKEDKTAELTATALKAGFCGIDTANYPTSYNEALAGDGISEALASGVKREDLFIQSKFTPVWAHDKDKVPFDPTQDIEQQVKESVEQTFSHLKVDYIDAFLLHAPYPDPEDNIKAWRVLESFVPHRLRNLGVSNMTLEQVQHIHEVAGVKPAIVQNRFYLETKYDLELRSFCRDHGIVYQAFYILRHNPEIINSEVVQSVAQRLAVDQEVAFYLLILCLRDIQVLDGTTRLEAMEVDLQTVAKVVSDEEVLESLQTSVFDFKGLLWKLANQQKI
ncbi:hypothetical protein COL922a_008049 [Colletotrichum nupharicola]|nr:hypothetical protein COL922a_008049 [Colletotrichum nupharicola]